MTVRVVHGDMLAELPKLAAEGFRAHAVVTDPPYHLSSIVKRFGADNAAPAKAGKTGAYARASAGFMGQQWDGGDIAFQPETWRTVLDCMRPGAFLVAFASTRGYHRMVCAIEDAGFVIHPMLGWLFASGFPKATRFQHPELEGWRYGLQALKPALEPICLAQKSLDGTGSANWDRHGCGGLNIEASRVATNDRLGGGDQSARTKVKADGWDRPWMQDEATKAAHAERVNANVAKAEALGRWPANLAHDGSDEVEAAFGAFGESKSTDRPRHNTADAHNRTSSMGASASDWVTSGHNDTGTASRFFFCAKADASDRAGSRHPTIKPTALMRWLVRLVTPPGGTVLDPFAGSGSTGLAADQLGFNAVLIEREAQYAADARRKIAADAPLLGSVA